MSTTDTLRVLKAAAEGDEDAIKEIHVALEMRRALQELGGYPTRQALMVIGRYYLGVSAIELGKVFRASKTTVLRLSNLEKK